jgi:hypothetical protein
MVEVMAETYRSDLNVVGVWMLLDPKEPGTEYLIAQRKDQSAELTVFKPGWEPFLSDGKIAHDRTESGHPIRQTVFISNFDHRRIIIESREF